ncbi:MAG: LysE family translocator [Proteobacteria bacterium]|nr:LysE family translocator [Pseudomonadota bacterium]
MTADLFGLFVVTIAAVSLTPGMCMTLAFSLGLSQGYRKTLWMMAGEMTGVIVVVSSTVYLLGWLLRLDPMWFNALALTGAVYLLWIARQLWLADPALAEQRTANTLTPLSLAVLGFTTAIMNPKGWAFMVALLPGFMDGEKALFPQLALFLSVMLTTEFISLSLYAGGGRWLRQFLGEGARLGVLNKLAASLMVGVSILVFI